MEQEQIKPEKNISGRGMSKCKVLELLRLIGLSLKCSRKRKRAEFY